jgi:hypothetical protein
MQFLESEHDEVQVGSSDRNFGFTMAAAFTLIGGVGIYKGSSYAALWLGLAIVFAGLALRRPQSLQFANKAWLRLGLVMYSVVNPVIMAILFFGVMLPIGFCLRIFGKDLLRLTRDSSASTYWLPRSDPRPLQESMRQQF